MTHKEFNDKWRNHIKDNFYGLEFDIPRITILLDKLFEEIIILKPDFEFSQIKVKFNMVRFYSNLPIMLSMIIESYIQRQLK